MICVGWFATEFHGWVGLARLSGGDAHVLSGHDRRVVDIVIADGAETLAITDGRAIGRVRWSIADIGPLSPSLRIIVPTARYRSIRPLVVDQENRIGGRARPKCERSVSPS
jgi:hypothetical protein